MRQTEHYGLNLWDLSDRIKMENFNNDNAKLDAALHALSVLAAPDNSPNAQILSLFPMSTPTNSPSISIVNGDETDWNNWTFVAAHGSVTDPTANTTPCAYLGGPSSVPYTKFDKAKFYFSPGDFLYLLMPFRDNSRNVEGFFFASEHFHHFSLDVPFSQLSFFGARAEHSNGLYAEAMIPFLRSFGIR